LSVALAQRKLFAHGLIELANIVAGALVFGQFIVDHPLQWGTLAFGILIAASLYLGAYGFTKQKGN
jgi:hypothetical protein